MKFGKWPYFLFCIFIFSGNFLITNGETNLPKWSNQVETELRFNVHEMPGDIEAKISFDKERNAVAILWRTNAEPGKLKQEQLLIYDFDNDTKISVLGHECDVAPSIEREENSVQFLEKTPNGVKLKDFGSLLFFDVENYAENPSAEWSELYGAVMKWERSLHVNLEGFPQMSCNFTHYITNVKVFGVNETDEENYLSHIVKIEASCLPVLGPDEEEVTKTMEFEANFFWNRNSISDPEVFQQPPGVYCPSVTTTKDYPSMPPYFSFNFLTLDSDSELGVHLPVTSFRKKIWYDSKNKLIRKDNLDWDFDVIVTMISDFNSKLSYIISSSGDCSINELKSTDTMESEIALPGDNFPLFPGSTSDVPQYVGQRKRYGITFNVWVSRNKIEETIQISDYYFTTNVLSEDNTNITSPAFIEMFIFNSEGTVLIGSVLQLISEYRTKSNIQHQSAFDVTSCFPESNKTRFSLTFASKDNSDLGVVNQGSLMNEVRKKLLSVMKVSKMRLGALQISFMDENTVAFSSILAEDPTRLGFKQGKEETSNKEAIKAVDELINDKNLLISVDTLDTPSKKIVLNAIKLKYPDKSNNKDDKDNNKDKDEDTKGKKHGFSGGALAGVGIAMLAVGMFQGIVLLVAYIRYRRNDPLVRKLTASEDTHETKPGPH